MKTRKQTTSAQRKRKIVIIDDHPLLRTGLAQVIDQQEDLVVCGEAEDAPQGMSVVRKTRPDAVIVDISLGAGSGLELIKNLYGQDPDLPLLALSVHHENLYAERALDAGAMGYVMKREPVERALAALRKVLDGKTAVSEEIVCRMLGKRKAKGRRPTGHSPADLLSDRELEVFRLLGEGRGTRDIGSSLGISPSTIETYRSSIKHKLSLTNGTALVARAAAFITEEQNERALER